LRINDAIYALGEFSSCPPPSNDQALSEITSIVKQAIALPIIGFGVYDNGFCASAAGRSITGPWNDDERKKFTELAAWAKDDRVLARRLEQSDPGRVFRRSQLMEHHEFTATRLYNEFHRPLGFGDQCLARFQRTDSVELLFVIAGDSDSANISNNTLSAAQAIAPYAARAWASTWNANPDWATGITPNARLVLTLVLKGYDDTQISNQLGISYHAVRAHLKRMFRRAGVRSRLQLMQQARANHHGAPLIEHKPTQPALHR
jgi:DNA-binding CsgD family transcriptional regulator